MSPNARPRTGAVTKFVSVFCVSFRPPVLSMYVCIYVCMSLCVYVCMYVCMYVRTYVRTYVCMYVCMYVCLFICLCTSTYAPPPPFCILCLRINEAHRSGVESDCLLLFRLIQVLVVCISVRRDLAALQFVLFARLNAVGKQMYVTGAMSPWSKRAFTVWTTATWSQVP